MKEIDKSYLIKKINKLNKKIHRSESQENDNKTWWRKMKLKKLTEKLKHLQSVTMGAAISELLFTIIYVDIA